MTRFILTDIEGTTTDIAFVHQVLFPYSRRKIADFVTEHETVPEVAACLKSVREQIIQTENQAFTSLQSCIETLIYWIDSDKKEPALKQLQGLIWQNGYETGEFTGHVYADVPPQLAAWQAQNIGVGIYSSGSVAAQKLLFGYSDFGNLKPYFSHYFDTGVGHKQQRTAYQNIVQTLQLPAAEILFISDIGAELDAAAEAGLQTIQLVRGNTIPALSHTQVADFQAIQLK
jgi:enolase-phosphatase E1